MLVRDALTVLWRTNSGHRLRTKGLAGWETARYVRVAAAGHPVEANPKRERRSFSVTQADLERKLVTLLVKWPGQPVQFEEYGLPDLVDRFLEDAAPIAAKLEPHIRFK